MGEGAGAAPIIDSRPCLQIAVAEAEEEIRLEFTGQEDLRRQVFFLQKGNNLLDLTFDNVSPFAGKLLALSEPLAKPNSEGLSADLQSHGLAVVDDVAEIQSVAGQEGCGSKVSTKLSGLVSDAHTPSRSRIEPSKVVYGLVKDQTVKDWTNSFISTSTTDHSENGQKFERDKLQVLFVKDPSLQYVPCKNGQASLQGNTLPIDCVHNLSPKETIQSRLYDCNEQDPLSRKEKHVWSHSHSSNNEGIDNSNVSMLEMSSRRRDATFSSQTSLFPSFQIGNSVSKHKEQFSDERKVANFHCASRKGSSMTDIADCNSPSTVQSNKQVEPAILSNLSGVGTAFNKSPLGAITRSNLSLTPDFSVDIHQTSNSHGGGHAEGLASLDFVGQCADLSYSDNSKKLYMSSILLSAPKNSFDGNGLFKKSNVESKVKNTIATSNWPESLGNVSCLDDGNVFQDLRVHQESNEGKAVPDTSNVLSGELPTNCLQRADKVPSLEKKKATGIEEKGPIIAECQENTVLESVEVLKNLQDQIAMCASQSPASEPSTQKSHWEFVLEEVAWMANDFMQERLWKVAAAAQLSQWAVQSVWHSQFKADPKVKLSESERKKSTLNTGKRPTKTLRPIGAALTRESLPASNPIECFDNDIKVAASGSLFYVVPEGAIKSYRRSAERDWAAGETEHWAEGAQVSLVNDLDMVAFGRETKHLIGQSLARIGFGEEVNKFETQDITSSLDSSGAPQSVVVKRKRKQFLKETNRYPEAAPNPGLYALNSDALNSIPSVHTTSRRSFASSYDANRSNVGSIPTKRLRTAALATRQLANNFPGSEVRKVEVVGLEENVLADTMESQLKGLHSLSEVSPCFKNAKTESSPRNSAHGATSEDFCSSPILKRKKNTKFHSVALSSTADGASHASNSGKLPNLDYVQQYEQEWHVEQKAQIKRRTDQLQTTSNVSSSNNGLGRTYETAENLESQNAVEQHLKKVKLSKQLPEEHQDILCTPNQAQLVQTSPVNLTSSHKTKPNNIRERTKKTKLSKPPANQPGVGIPWSSIEDQAIVALVHDLGPNWELVSDVLSSSSHLKGIFRKPMDCEARYKVLLSCLSHEVDCPEDVTNYATSSSSKNPKGSIRLLLQRLQGPMEEDTLKVHFERIVRLVQQHNQTKKDSQKLQEILAAHVSHAGAMSQLSCSSLTGSTFTPLDLCDQPSLNGEAPTNAFIAPPLNPNRMGLSGVLSAGCCLRPSSASLSLLPGVQWGPALSPSSAVFNAARDAQWLAASMRSLSAEEQRLRYTQLVTGRGLPQDTSPGNVSLMNLSHPIDKAVPSIPMTNNGMFIGGLSKSMSLLRPSTQSLLVTGISGMVSSAITCMLPSAGGEVANTSTLAADSVSGQSNLMRISRDPLQVIRAGQVPDDHRLMLMQGLQHQASLGNNHARAVLSSFQSTVVSSPMHPFVLQQQQAPPHLQPQPSNQAYCAALQLAKEQRLQWEQEQHQQQHQHHKRLVQHNQQQQVQCSTSIQTPSLSLAQHPSNQQKLHPQLVNPTLHASNFHEQSVMPSALPTLQTSRPHLLLTPTHHKNPGTSVQDSSHQVLNHQQLQLQIPSREMKSLGRERMINLPGISSQTGQSSLLAIPVVESQRSLQFLQQPPNHLQGQIVVPAASPIQLESQVNFASGHATSEQLAQVPLQSQSVDEADNSFAILQQQKELLLQQQLAVKQQQPSQEHSYEQEHSQPTIQPSLLPQHLPPTMAPPQQQLSPASPPTLARSPPTQSLQCHFHSQSSVLQPQPGPQDPPKLSKTDRLA